MKIRVLEIIAVLTFGMVLLNACNNNTTKENGAGASVGQANEDLKGYMLSGIYTINGYGGIAAVEENVGNNDEVESYTQLLAFPFEKGAEGVKESLSNMWDINSKEDLIKKLGELLNNEKSNYKAWDYARLVNNVNMGYAAGYLTKEEGNEWIKKTLPKAKASFKTWEEYHKNFMEGRKNWSPDDEENGNFEELSKNISNMSVYKNNPLN